MADYIERDAAIRIAERYSTTYGSALGRHSGVADCIASEISGLPSADVAPVVHGRWVDGKCSNCGAKMDGGVDDEAD